MFCWDFLLVRRRRRRRESTEVLFSTLVILLSFRKKGLEESFGGEEGEEKYVFAMHSVPCDVFRICPDLRFVLVNRIMNGYRDVCGLG